MKKWLIVISIISSVFIMAACGSKTEEVVEETEPVVEEIVVEEPEPEPIEEVDPYEGMAINSLTGLYIDEEIAQKRPFAVVINNLAKALPQSGIGDADIYYEVMAEGGITRIIAVFQELKAEKIGPIRSTREYFTYFALDNDAYLIHHGGSEGGYSAVRNRGVNNLDGMVSNAFWRDKTRANTAGMYEHSSYIDSEGLLEAIENAGYRTEKEKDGMFLFYEEDTMPDGESTVATNVELPYLGNQSSQFRYNLDTNLYERIQGGKEQIDELTGEILTVKNVILQFANTNVISGDNAGRINVDLVGSGNGVYITNGRAVNITWSKTSYSEPTKWFDENGNALNINKGKTWICVYPTYKEYTVE